MSADKLRAASKAVRDAKPCTDRHLTVYPCRETASALAVADQILGGAS